MIADRLPELANFSNEEKWQLMAELQDQLVAGDVTEEEPLKSEIGAILNERLAHYQANPQSGVTLDGMTALVRAEKGK